MIFAAGKRDEILLRAQRVAAREKGTRNKRAYRRRQKAGQIVLNIEVMEIELAEALEASGRLRIEQTEDRAALEAAATRILADWMARVSDIAKASIDGQTDPLRERTDAPALENLNAYDKRKNSNRP